jgi:hypothetical protein
MRFLFSLILSISIFNLSLFATGGFFPADADADADADANADAD